MLRSRRHAVALTLTLAFAACATDQAFGPGETLRGRWGGANVELVADGTRVRILLPCAVAETASPVTVTADGTVAGDATMAMQWGPSGSVHFHGRLLPTGSLVLVIDAPFAIAGTLRDGARGDFSGAVCLAAGH